MYSSDSTVPSKKVNTFQCRQLVIPIEVVQQVHDGTITVKQAYLLAIIDALVESRGIGCFANNGYLAKWLQTEPRQVHNILAPLIKDGLIKISESSTGGRLLETQWSRIAEDGNKLHGGSNKLHTHSKKLPKQHGKKLPHIDSKSIDRPRSANGSTKFPFGNGESYLPSISQSAIADEFHQRIKKYVLIHRADIKAPDPKVGRKWWIKLFASNPHEQFERLIKQVLQFYYAYLDSGEYDQYMPEVFSAKSLCDKFDKLGSAMRRNGEAPEERETPKQPERRIIRYKGRRWQKCDAEVYENHNCSWRDVDSMEEIRGLHLRKGAICESCKESGGCKPDCPADHFDYWQEQHQMGRAYLKSPEEGRKYLDNLEKKAKGNRK